VIEDDEADAVSALDQLFGEEDLLSLGSTDVCQVFALGERGVSAECDEADRRLPEPRRSFALAGRGIRRRTAAVIGTV
jgi:hypothetical protein